MSPEPEVFMPKAHHQTGRFKRTEDPRAGQPDNLKMIELMGGSPTPISFGEVYTAMQQGVVDGAENNVPSRVQTRHIEIAKVFSEDEHASIPDFLVISSKTWDKLTPGQQQIWSKRPKPQRFISNSCGRRSTPIPALRPKPWGRNYQSG